jgi:hypothetical protein
MILFAMATMSMASRLTQPSTQDLASMHSAPDPAPASSPSTPASPAPEQRELPTWGLNDIDFTDWRLSLSDGPIGACEQQVHAQHPEWKEDQSILDGCKYRALELMKQETYWAEWKSLKFEAARRVPGAEEKADEMVKRGLVTP